MRIAVVDLGKTNAKLAWVDAASATETDVRTMPSPCLSGSTYPHLDTEAIEAFLVESLRAGGPIDAITVTTHGATVALLDDAGALALPVLDYEHDGPDTVHEDYVLLRPPFEETGSPRLPAGLNVGAQLYWQQRVFPEAFARVRCVLTWPQYWVHRLCGVRRNDVSSLGCHTDLFCPTDSEPSSLVEQQGWSTLLPAVCRSGERLGTLTDDFAEATGLSVDVAVHAGIHDSNASLVPHLLAGETPISVVSTGTWVVVMAVGGRDVMLDERRDTLVNVDAFGRPVRSARFMGGREYALLTAQDEDAPKGRKGVSSAALIERLTRAGAWLLPSVVGATGPFPERVASWTVSETELDERFGAGARDAVIAGYLAGMTRCCIDLAGGSGVTVVEGPFAGNADYLQALAANVPGPLRLSASRTGTSIGAAMLVAPPDGSIEMQDVQSDSATTGAWQAYLKGWREHASDNQAR